jgi:hypothetical protein
MTAIVPDPDHLPPAVFLAAAGNAGKDSSRDTVIKTSQRFDD